MSGGERLLGELGDDGSVEGEGEGVGLGLGESRGIAEGTQRGGGEGSASGSDKGTRRGRSEQRAEGDTVGVMQACRKEYRLARARPTWPAPERGDRRWEGRLTIRPGP